AQPHVTSPMRPTLPLLCMLTATACTAGSPDLAGTEGVEPTGAPPATVVQPGAPGQDTRVVEAGSFSEFDLPPWTETDADFMSGMIHHHAQALQMTALIPERSVSAGVRQMGLRMEISQRDEIRLMQRWLAERDLNTPDVVLTPGPTQGMMDHAAMGHDMGEMGGTGGLMQMPGMLSAEQMAELRAAEGETFDRLFLEYMIQHHTGAIAMVAELFATPGAGQDSKVFQFADDVDADQRAEIDRMRMLLAQYR
ncbi:MAG TPA: DUF305 domain-containing protein, partial [Longimicrobiales bacterium]|nr:DUF305 domain-containing protein [Longimicrobiales bacterium]